MKIVVNALIKNKKSDKFLIIKRKSGDKIHSGKWAFPGGRVKEGEDLLDALKREIKEEIAIDIKNDFKKISEYEYKDNKEIVFGVCYSCTALDGRVSKSKEIEDFAWIKPGELNKLDHISDIDKEVKKVFKS